MIANPNDDAVEKLLAELKTKWGKGADNQIVASLSQAIALGCSRRRAAKAIGCSEGSVRNALRNASPKAQAQTSLVSPAATGAAKPHSLTVAASAAPVAAQPPAPTPSPSVDPAAPVQTTATLTKDAQVSSVWEVFLLFRQLNGIHDGHTIVMLLEQVERRVSEIEVFHGLSAVGPAPAGADLETVIRASRPTAKPDEFYWEVWVHTLAFCAFRLAPDPSARSTALRELRAKYQRHAQDTKVVPLYSRPSIAA